MDTAKMTRTATASPEQPPVVQKTFIAGTVLTAYSPAPMINTPMKNERFVRDKGILYYYQTNNGATIEK